MLDTQLLGGKAVSWTPVDLESSKQLMFVSLRSATSLIAFLTLLLSQPLLSILKHRLTNQSISSSEKSNDNASARRLQDWSYSNRDTIILLTGLMSLTLAIASKYLSPFTSSKFDLINAHGDIEDPHAAEESHIFLLVLTVALGTLQILAARSPTVLPLAPGVKVVEKGLGAFIAGMGMEGVLQLMLWGRGVGVEEGLVVIACGLCEWCWPFVSQLL